MEGQQELLLPPGCGPAKAVFRFTPAAGQHVSRRQLKGWIPSCRHADVQRTNPDQDVGVVALLTVGVLLLLGHSLRTLERAVRSQRVT